MPIIYYSRFASIEGMLNHKKPRLDIPEGKEACYSTKVTNSRSGDDGKYQGDFKSSHWNSRCNTCNNDAACKLTISSLQGPDTSETGAIINLTITGQGTESSNTTEYGLILQIPEHWEVISANVSVMITQYPLKENLAIESLYSPQPGYKVWAGTTTERYGVLATVSLCVGNLPGNEGDMENYVIKAMAGASRSGTWCTDDPQDVFDFAAVTKSKYLKSITVTKTFDQGIFIPDPNLESAIREALETGPCDPITQDMAHILTTLNAESRAIFDLSGLEYFLNLTDLRLGWNQIPDITALVENTGLGNEDYVNLYNNPLSSAQACADLQTLRDRGVYLGLDPSNICLGDLAGHIDLSDLAVFAKAGFKI